MLEKIFGTKKYAEVSPDELYALLKNKNGAAFIDVRRGDEWNTGHIDEFMHIPLSEIPTHMSQLSAYPKIYFICRSGGRSKMACDMMKEAGYDNAVNVKGGLIAWQSKKYPIVSNT